MSNRSEDEQERERRAKVAYLARLEADVHGRRTPEPAIGAALARGRQRLAMGDLLSFCLTRLFLILAFFIPGYPESKGSTAVKRKRMR